MKSSIVDQKSVWGVMMLTGGWGPHGALLVWSPLESIP